MILFVPLLHHFELELLEPFTVLRLQTCESAVKVVESVSHLFDRDGVPLTLRLLEKKIPLTCSSLPTRSASRLMLDSIVMETSAAIPTSELGHTAVIYILVKM